MGLFFTFVTDVKCSENTDVLHVWPCRSLNIYVVCVPGRLVYIDYCRSCILVTFKNTPTLISEVSILCSPSQNFLRRYLMEVGIVQSQLTAPVVCVF
jgi:hypothetical protein